MPLLNNCLKLVLVGVLAFCNFAEAASKIPSWVKACSVSDGPLAKCVVQRIAEAQPYIMPGYPKYRIPRLDPLEVTTIAVESGSKQIGLSLKIFDANIFALKTAEFYRAEVDFDKKHWNLWWRNPRIMVLGKYIMDGKVLILPITGTGNGNVTLTDVTGDFGFDYELIEKNGKTHANITKSTMEFSASRAYFKFDNLFNGDKHLGPQMNAFMNENYAEVMREFGPAVGDAFKHVFKQILQNAFDLVPLEYAFPGYAEMLGLNKV